MLSKILCLQVRLAIVNMACFPNLDFLDQPVNKEVQKTIVDTSRRINKLEVCRTTSSQVKQIGCCEAIAAVLRQFDYHTGK
jgi:hypothetical protein